MTTEQTTLSERRDDGGLGSTSRSVEMMRQRMKERGMSDEEIEQRLQQMT